MTRVDCVGHSEDFYAKGNGIIIPIFHLAHLYFVFHKKIAPFVSTQCFEGCCFSSNTSYTAVNAAVLMSLHTSVTVSLGQIPGSGTSGSYVRLWGQAARNS